MYLCEEDLKRIKELKTEKAIKEEIRGVVNGDTYLSTNQDEFEEASSDYLIALLKKLKRLVKERGD